MGDGEHDGISKRLDDLLSKQSRRVERFTRIDMSHNLLMSECFEDKTIGQGLKLLLHVQQT